MDTTSGHNAIADRHESIAATSSAVCNDRNSGATLAYYRAVLGTWIAIAIAVVIVAGVLGVLVLNPHKHSRSHTLPELQDTGSTPLELSRLAQLPASGLLVPEGVLAEIGNDMSVWDALEASAVPLAFEYFPVSDVELARYHSVPVNAAAQQSLTDLVKAVGPKGPTLFKVVLPKDASLVRAVGTSGFRGFSRQGGKTVHAVLKPVGVGGAAAAGWPVLAVAGSVMALDMVAQREQRAHQDRVETLLGRQELRYERRRIASQRTTDQRLSAGISRMLDGQEADLEGAHERAADEFHDAVQFLEQKLSVVQAVAAAAGADGRVDYRKLEESLGGKARDMDHFLRELHFARAGIALGRKALLAEAASAAIRDPANAYSALRKHFDVRSEEVRQAEMKEIELTSTLNTLELRGPWHEGQKWIELRQAKLREKVAPPALDSEEAVQFVAMPSGEIHQLVPITETTEVDDEAPVYDSSTDRE